MRFTRITLTTLGLKGVLLLIVLELAFLATPYSNLFFTLIAYCVVLGTLGLCWSLRNAAGITMHRCSARPSAAHVERQIEIGLSGGSRRRFDLAIEAEVSGSWIEIAHTPLLDGDVVLDATVPGLPRGVHTWHRLRLVSRWPLGLFRVRRQLTANTELVTWPQPVHDPDEEPLHNDQEARHQDSVAGLRPFRAGDPISIIHWKATARRGEPISREHSSVDTLELVLDRRCNTMELERRLSSATANILTAIADDRPIRLRSHDYTGDTRAGETMDGMLRWLAGTQILPGSKAESSR